MTDVSRLFADLQQLSDTLNRESDSLTAEITEFETSLVQLKLGITLWYHEPVKQHRFEADSEQHQTATYLVFAKGNGGWGLYLRSCDVGVIPEEPQDFFAETRLRDAAREDRVTAVKLFPGLLEAMVDAARGRVQLIRQGREQVERVNARDAHLGGEAGDVERGTAMLNMILDVYEAGKDCIPGWKLKQHAEDALARGGVEGLRRYYEACLRGRGDCIKATLERNGRKTLESEYSRFMAIYGRA
jgi:hypothetical protein